MPRMPNCASLSQTKHPDTNEGNAEYHCSRFNWTDTAFNTETILGITTYTVQHINGELFNQCQTCPHKTS